MKLLDANIRRFGTAPKALKFDSDKVLNCKEVFAWCRDNGQEDFSRYTSLAKAYATEAFVRTGLDSVQLHGAIGFTTEYDIQLYFKRSKWARPMFGDADFHYERVLELRGV